MMPCFHKTNKEEITILDMVTVSAHVHNACMHPTFSNNNKNKQFINQAYRTAYDAARLRPRFATPALVTWIIIFLESPGRPNWKWTNRKLNDIHSTPLTSEQPIARSGPIWKDFTVPHSTGGSASETKQCRTQDGRWPQIPSVWQTTT